MARLKLAGCETRWVGGTGNVDLPDGSHTANGGTITADTTTVRSGSAAWKFDSGAAGTGTPWSIHLSSATDGRSYFARIHVRIAANPTSASVIMFYGNTSPTVDIGARLRTDGSLELVINGAVQGSPSTVITDNAWHRVELKGVAVATSQWNAGELVVDGVTVATASVTAFNRAAGTQVFSFGWINAPGVSKVLYVDDMALNDSTGSVSNGYPGDGKAVLLLPTADSAIGTGWTDDNAATASLFTSVDNTPPTGIADTTTGGGGHQIRNATSNANVNYDATMQTYTAVGIGATDTITVVQPVVITGAPSTTAPKQGTVGVVSNPAITNVALGTTGTAGAFVSTSGAGTFGASWKGSSGTVTDAPSVTKSTAPVMRITQVTSSTRIAMVCFMGMYVEYVPAVVSKPKRYAQSYSIAHRRAALR